MTRLVAPIPSLLALPRLLVLVTSLLTVGCGAPLEPSRGLVAASNELVGKWSVTALVTEGEEITGSELASVQIEFGTDWFSATAGCNSGGGSWEVGEDRKLTLRDEGWTERGCDDQTAMRLEGKLAAIFSRVSQYTLEDGVLTLSAATDEYRLVLIRQEPPIPSPLLGTTWRLQGFEETFGDGPGAAVSYEVVQPEHLIEMLITDGEVTGSTACGGFTAQVLVANDSIEFKDISIEDMDCSAEAMEQRDRFKQQLMDVRHVGISGQNLRLSNADRSRSLLFTAQD